jgi:lipid-binding SYLF domain-containing protein
MNRYFVSALIGCTLVAFAGLPAQGIAASKADKHEKEVKEAKATIADFEKKDPSLKKFFGTSYGYVVFPKIGKGGFIVGGAHGKGVVFKKQEMVGFASVIQGTIGLQIGGQTFAEVIFLQDDKTFDNFTKNKVEFAAQATAVAVNAGAGATAKYEDGVAIFTAGEKGFMAEAAVGGQKFKYTPAM